MVLLTRCSGLMAIAVLAYLGSGVTAPVSAEAAAAQKHQRRPEDPGAKGRGPDDRRAHDKARDPSIPQIDAGLDPLVVLSWPGLKKRRVLDLADERIELRAENRSDHAVSAVIEMYPNGVRSRVPFPVREAFMEPRDAVTFGIDLDQLGFDLDRLRSSASLRVLVRARVVSDDGGIGRVDHSFSPTIYFHKRRRGSRAGGIRVYDELTMQRRMGNGSSHQNPACTLTFGTPQFPRPPGVPGLGFALQMDIDPGDGDPQPDHTDTVAAAGTDPGRWRIRR